MSFKLKNYKKFPGAIENVKSGVCILKIGDMKIQDVRFLNLHTTMTNFASSIVAFPEEFIMSSLFRKLSSSFQSPHFLELEFFLHSSSELLSCTNFYISLDLIPLGGLKQMAFLKLYR